MMSFKSFAAALLLAVTACAAEAPLPALRIEPTTGASIFYVRNTYSQPLTAFLIELAGYPGSYFQLWQDDVTSEPIAPGVEKRIQVSDMTAGAVPDYVKVEAAIYADGTTAGMPDKITQLTQRRAFLLKTTRELIQRLNKAQTDNTPKAALVDSLKQWADSLPRLTKSTKNSQTAINQSAAKTLIGETAAQLDAHSIPDTLTSLHSSEQALATSKPSLPEAGSNE